MIPSLIRAWGIVAIGCVLAAQAQDTFKSRLSPVPIDAQLAPKIAGHGSVSASLSGTKLTLNGTFEGMRSAATSASLHQSKMTGVRGPMIHELTVAKAAGGNVSGAVDLTSAEVEALRKGLVYVVISSEGAPDGNLWGWLLK
ncbi:MAG TPA: CHRD domain-containing protein [Bryobacteraceae bacterium]|nr:CHRD domain-containing protein [Bryobacteraceae bacterium]